MFRGFSVLRSIPNMTVIAPSDQLKCEVQRVRCLSIRTSLRTGRVIQAHLSDEGNFQIGKGATLKSGTDVTIVACGVQLLDR